MPISRRYNIQTCRYPDVTISRHDDIQTCRYPDMTISIHDDIQTCRYPLSRHDDIQTCRYPDKTKSRPWWILLHSIYLSFSSAANAESKPSSREASGSRFIQQRANQRKSYHDEGHAESTQIKREREGSPDLEEQIFAPLTTQVVRRALPR